MASWQDHNFPNSGKFNFTQKSDWTNPESNMMIIIEFIITVYCY